MTSTVAPATSLRSICRGTRPSKNAARSAFSSGCAAGQEVAGIGFVSAAAGGAAFFGVTAVCGGSASAGSRMQTARRPISMRSRVMSPPKDSKQRTECLGNEPHAQYKFENSLGAAARLGLTDFSHHSSGRIEMLKELKWASEWEGLM